MMQRVLEAAKFALERQYAKDRSPEGMLKYVILNMWTTPITSGEKYDGKLLIKLQMDFTDAILHYENIVRMDFAQKIEEILKRRKRSDGEY